MANRITLRKVGRSIVATFPTDILHRMRVGIGDTLTVVRTDRGILLTPYDPVFEHGMHAYEEINAEYRNALRKLADT